MFNCASNFLLEMECLEYLIVYFRIILRDVRNLICINLTLQRTTKNSLSRVGFELASSGFESRDRRFTNDASSLFSAVSD